MAFYSDEARGNFPCSIESELIHTTQAISGNGILQFPIRRIGSNSELKKDYILTIEDPPTQKQFSKKQQ